jgi:hypothetical protein
VSCCVAHTGLGLMTLLSKCFECWGYRHASPLLAKGLFLLQKVYLE